MRCAGSIDVIERIVSITAGEKCSGHARRCEMWNSLKKGHALVVVWNGGKPESSV